MYFSAFNLILIMTKVLGSQFPYSVLIQKKVISVLPFGVAFFGYVNYGSLHLSSGIYQMRKCREGRIPVKMEFYSPGAPKDPGQIASQQKLSAAVLAWQNLTDEQRLVYSKKAVGLHMSGYNLFIKYYMLS